MTCKMYSAIKSTTQTSTFQLMYKSLLTMGIFPILLTVFAVGAAVPRIDRGLDGRIINGILAAKGQFPYQVAVLMKYSNFVDRCGGALISTEWVVTAAHCFNEKGILSVSIVLGSNSIAKELDVNQVNINAAKWLVHENYTKTHTHKYDIALVKLATPVTLSAKIQPITLNTEELKPYTPVTVSGWGLVNGNRVPNDLSYVVLKTLSRDECQKTYGSEIDEMICTVSNDSTLKTVCNGDSGGPLVTNTTNGVVHVGVVSFGYGGCGTKYPDAYTRTDVHRAWIKNVTGV